MITHIELDGFRTFLDTTIDLTPFTVVAGQNGSGKTNLLEAVGLAAQLVRQWPGWDEEGHPFGGHEGADRGKRFSGPLLPGGDRRGTLTDLFSRAADGTPSSRLRVLVRFLHWEQNHGLRHIEMEFTIRRKHRTREAPTVTYSVELLADPSPFWGLSEDALRSLRNNADFARNHVHYGAADDWYRLVPDPELIRNTLPDLYDNGRMRRDGSNLAAVLGRLLADPDRDRERAFWLQADITSVLPGLVEVRPVENAAASRWELELVYSAAAPIPITLASDGTLRVLAVLAAAHDPLGLPTQPALNGGSLMVEDIENGLHPGQVRSLVERLRRLTGDVWNRQLIVTTHSPVVLAALLPEHADDVLFMDSVTRVGQDRPPFRHTRVRRLAEDGERGTYVGPSEARQFLESASAGTG